MLKTAVRSDGTLPLGDAAARLGFVPGALVDVIVTSAGTLILRIDDEPVIDVPFKFVTGWATRKAIQARETS